jgi:hypothetical protein
VAHIDECVAFGEKQGLKGNEFVRAKKLAEYLKSGGSTPGSCKTGEECKTYCSDLAHADECAAFAKKAGIETAGGKGKEGGPSDEQLKKLAELAAKGETPGGCTNKDECRAYCQDKTHFEECSAFAQKMGFVKKEDTERAKKILTDGGPGGCKSAEECHAYCDTDVNHDECFKFAEEHGLIKKDDIDKMKEGMVRMRQGISNAPEEVQECLKTALGDDTVSDIEAGRLNPSKELGEKARTCFEKFKGTQDPTKVMKEASPSVAACMKEKLGDTYGQVVAGKTEPNVEAADAFRVCHQKAAFEGGSASGNKGQGTPPPPEKVKEYIKNAPEAVRICLSEKLGDKLAEIESGETTLTPELMPVIKGCFDQFRPVKPMMQGGMNSGGEGTKMPMMGSQNGGMPAGQGGTMPQLPAAVLVCVKEKLGAETEMPSAGTPPSAEFKAAAQECMSKLQPKPPVQGSGTTNTPIGTEPKPPMGGQMMMTPPSGTEGTAMNWVIRLPAPVQNCLKEKYAGDLEALGQKPPTTETQAVVKACFASVGIMPTAPKLPEGSTMPAIPEGMMPSGDGTMTPKPPIQMELPPPEKQASFAKLLVSATVFSVQTIFDLFR